MRYVEAASIESCKYRCTPSLPGMANVQKHNLDRLFLRQLSKNTVIERNSSEVVHHAIH